MSVLPAVPGRVHGDVRLALSEAKAKVLIARAEAEEADRVAARARRKAAQAQRRYLNALEEAEGQLKLDL